MVNRRICSAYSRVRFPLAPYMKKYILSPHPFLGYRLYGPYMYGSNKRFFVVLQHKSSSRSMSLARYLLSVGLAKRIRRGYDADHIDGNPWNDSPHNLQVLRSVDNQSKGGSAQRSHKIIRFACPVCHK